MQRAVDTDRLRQLGGPETAAPEEEPEAGETEATATETAAPVGDAGQPPAEEPPGGPGTEAGEALEEATSESAAVAETAATEAEQAVDEATADTAEPEPAAVVGEAEALAAGEEEEVEAEEAPAEAETTEEGEIVIQRAAADGPSVSVQRCGPNACNCSPEERAAHEAGPPAQRQLVVQRSAAVQRGIRDRLAGAAEAILPDWVTRRITGGSDEAKQRAGTVEPMAEQEARAAREGADETGAAVEEQTETLATDAEQEATDDETAAHEAAETTEAEVGESKEKAAGDAQRLAGMSGMLGQLLNPAIVGARPDQVDKVANEAKNVAGGVRSELKGLGSDIASAVREGIYPGGKWTCDISEMMSIGGNVKKAITNRAINTGKHLLGEERYAAVEQAVTEAVDGIRSTAKDIKRRVGDAVDVVSDVWEENVAGPARELYDDLTERASDAWDDVKSRVSDTYEEIVSIGREAWGLYERELAPKIAEFVDDAKEFISDKVQWVRDTVGSWWDRLPDFLKAKLTAAGAAIAGPAGLAIAAGKAAVDYIIENKEAIIDGARQLADAAMEKVAEAYQGAKETYLEVKEFVQAQGEELRERFNDAKSDAFKALDDLSGNRITAALKAAEEVKKKVTGKVCTALGDAAGPCFDQYAPQGVDTELKLSGELTVPVKGVPVTLGRAASVKLTRGEGTNSRKYTVVLTGQGVVKVGLEKEAGEQKGGSTSVQVSLPLGRKADIFKKLTGQGLEGAEATGAPGGSAAPTNAPTAGTATPAAGGGPAAPGSQPAAGEGGSGGKFSAEAGIKGSLSMTYLFDASKEKDESTCDGIGGMTAFLASQGLGAGLPTPLGQMVSMGGQASWADRLAKVQFTAAVFAGANFDLTAGGMADLKAKVAAERGLTITTTYNVEKGGAKGGTGKTSHTLWESIGGEIGGKLTKLADVQFKAGATGRQYVTLQYDPEADLILPETAGAQVSASLSLKESGKLASMLPARAAGIAMGRLGPILAHTNEGTITITAGGKVEHLNKLAIELDSLFSEAPETVTLARVWEKLRTHLESNVKPVLEVKLALGGTLAKIEAKSKEKGVGAGVGAELSQSKPITLYPPT